MNPLSSDLRYFIPSKFSRDKYQQTLESEAIVRELDSSRYENRDLNNSVMGYQEKPQTHPIMGR